MREQDPRLHLVGLVALVLWTACERRSAPAPSANQPAVHNIPKCGAAIETPPAFSVVGTRHEFEQLRLSRTDGTTISVACLLKLETGAVNLAGHAEWSLESILETNPSQRPRVADASGYEQRIGRPVLAVEIAPERGSSGPRESVIWMESALAFYWIRYSTSSAASDDLAKERDQVLGSFQITDPAADRGPTRWWRVPLVADPRTLSEARASFRTKVYGGRPARGFPGGPAPIPPAGTFGLINVKGPQGRLSAYLTPDPKDGKKHPAVIWAHGGFGDIDASFWGLASRSNDQSARAFREAGIVLAIGSWRAENDNPGDYELYYGEVDDFLALRDHVQTLPYVDPDRIYLAGHSSGGTLVLLAAEKSDGFRTAFSIGGSPMLTDLAVYDRYSGVPFDPADENEILLRSPAPFVRSIRRPTFYFEGGGPYIGAAQWMEDEAAKVGVPFKSFAPLQANHFSILAPLTELITRKILADTGPTTNIRFTSAEIDAMEVAH